LLEEVPGDTIAEVGAVDIADDGTFLVADRYRPRVRLYDAEGRFVAGHGRFGEGPFEYIRNTDVARDREGRVFVHDEGGRYSILNPPLEPDTLHSFPDRRRPRFAEGFADGVVQGYNEVGPQGRLQYWGILRDREGKRPWRVPAMPARIAEVPYWSSVASPFATSAGDTLLIANSFLYPVHMYGSDGNPIGEIGSPPPSFREAPELERGQFAFSDPGQAGTIHSTFENWLNSFTVIAGLHVVRNRWLVVAHGQVPMEAFPRFRVHSYELYALDVYDLRSGRKVMEDVPIPEGYRVLGGGPYLHVLAAIPPEPWTVLKLDLPF